MRTADESVSRIVYQGLAVRHDCHTGNIGATSASPAKRLLTAIARPRSRSPLTISVAAFSEGSLACEAPDRHQDAAEGVRVSHSAVRRALDSGIKRDELDHVATLAITTIGWPAAHATMTWINGRSR
jgi:hypothetical protein